MKNSILIALLGLSVSMVPASMAVADDDNRKWRSNKHSQKHHHHKKHVGKVKPPKHNHHRGKHRNHGHKNKHIAKHHGHNHHRNHRKHKSNTSFSITFGNDFPNIVYNHDYPQWHEPKRHYRQGPSIRERQDRQARRIRKGINNGQLVRREAKQLRREQRRIEDKKYYFKRDGRLNRHERLRLHQMLDVAGNNIRNKRHNHLTRDSRRHQQQYEYVWY